MRTVLILLSFLTSLLGVAQNSVGIGTTTPDTNAVLDIRSHTGVSQGMYMPRMTANKRLSIGVSTNANVGLLVYDTDSLALLQWTGSEWSVIGGNEPSTVIANPTRVATKKYYGISPVEFEEFTNGVNQYGSHRKESSGGYILAGDYSDNRTTLTASLNLPDGAVLNNVFTYIRDNDNGNATFTIFRKSLQPLSSPEAIMPRIISSGRTGVVVEYQTAFSAGDLAVIDNNRYAYFVEYYNDGADVIYLHGAKIEYIIDEIP